MKTMCVVTILLRAFMFIPVFKIMLVLVVALIKYTISYMLNHYNILLYPILNNFVMWKFTTYSTVEISKFFQRNSFVLFFFIFVHCNYFTGRRLSCFTFFFNGTPNKTFVLQDKEGLEPMWRLYSIGEISSSFLFQRHNMSGNLKEFTPLAAATAKVSAHFWRQLK